MPRDDQKPSSPKTIPLFLNGTGPDLREIGTATVCSGHPTETNIVDDIVTEDGDKLTFLYHADPKHTPKGERIAAALLHRKCDGLA